MLRVHKDGYRVVEVTEREPNGSGRGTVISADDRTVGMKRFWFSADEIVCECFSIDQIYTKEERARIDNKFFKNRKRIVQTAILDEPAEDVTLDHHDKFERLDQMGG